MVVLVALLGVFEQYADLITAGEIDQLEEEASGRYYGNIAKMLWNSRAFLFPYRQKSLSKNTTNGASLLQPQDIELLKLELDFNHKPISVLCARNTSNP